MVAKERFSAGVHENADSGWDSIGEIELTAAERWKLEEARHDRKFLSALVDNDPNRLTEQDTSASTNELQEISRRINAGVDMDMVAKSIINKLGRPRDLVNSPEEVISDLTPGAQWMLSYMCGYGGDNGMPPYKLDEFLNACPSPADFDPYASSFLEHDLANVSEDERQVYLSALNEFRYGIYGKRQEYWDSYGRIKSRAEVLIPHVEQSEFRRFGEVFRLSSEEAEKIFADANVGVNDEISAKMAKAKDKTQKRGLRNIFSGRKKEETLEYMDCSGAFVNENGDEILLTKEMLEYADLRPNFKFMIGGREISTSKLFKARGRDCVVGYVKADDGTVSTVSYYKSNSQGAWRMLPDYIKTDSGFWFGKGKDQCEEQLTLPFEAQAALAAIEGTQESADIKNADPDLLLFGNAQRIARRFDYYVVPRMKTSSEVNRPKDFYNYMGPDLTHRTRPERMIVNSDDEPNTDTCLVSWGTQTGISGKIKQEAFPSRNGRYVYTISTDEKGRSWVANIELTDSRVNSNGIKQDSLRCGDLITPIYEHTSQAGLLGDNDPSDRKESGGNQYVSMWPYIQKIPLIQKFMASRGE